MIYIAWGVGVLILIVLYVLVGVRIYEIEDARGNYAADMTAAAWIVTWPAVLANHLIDKRADRRTEMERRKREEEELLRQEGINT